MNKISVFFSVETSTGINFVNQRALVVSHEEIPQNFLNHKRISRHAKRYMLN